MDESNLEPSTSGLTVSPANQALNEEDDTGSDVLETSISEVSPETQAHYEQLAKRMFMFPSAILKEINELIDSGTVLSANKLRQVLQDRYKGTLRIPGKTTIQGYVFVRKRQKQKLDAIKQVLVQDKIDDKVIEHQASEVNHQFKSIYQDISLSIENKKNLLENLIRLCERRINIISKLQEDEPTAGYEQALMSYTREIRSITEVLLKMKAELQTEGEQELEQYINGKLSCILRSVLQAYSSIHGQDHLDLFKTNLKTKLKDNKLQDMDTYV